MAISIKNHEDRISALERTNATSKPRLVTIWSGSCGHGGRMSTNEGISNFDAIVTGTDGYGGVTSSIFPVPMLKNKAWYVASDTPWGSNVQNSSIQYVDDRTLLHQHKLGGGTIRWVIGLKLYYNFSYNTIREFYVVKFNKLRHYLCSHLQNSFRNKGGVIQNGY